MATIQIGNPDDVKHLHLMGTFDDARFPTQASQERAVARVIQAVESTLGEFIEGKAQLNLYGGSGSYTLSLVIRDDCRLAAREIGGELHRRMKELWPPGLT